MNVRDMDQSTRKKLVQMACVAAWSDLDVADEEREVVMRMAMDLALDEATLAEVRGWLKAPPPEFDPYDIPHRHREAFLEAMMEVARADGRLDPEECVTFNLIRELVA